MKHTLGPWHVGEAIMGRRFTKRNMIEIQAMGGAMVAVTHDMNWSMDGSIDRSNACLIAAAPDLLEACRAALQRLYVHQGATTKAVCRQIEDAIAKALGEARTEQTTAVHSPEKSAKPNSSTKE